MNVGRIGTYGVLSLLTITFALSGCERKQSSTSRISLNLPRASQSSSLLGKTLTANETVQDRMCYFINITGGDTTLNQANTCEIPKGIVTDSFLTPGSVVTIDVPKSSNKYSLQLIGYLRSSSLYECPQLNSAKHLSALDQSKLYQIGTADFMIEQPETTVEVVSHAPSQTLQSQYSLDSGCVNGPPTLSLASASVTEGDGSGASDLSFAATLSHASDSIVYVDYATSSVTATASTDFISTSGTLKFMPGETSKTILVPAVQDTVGEPDETLQLILSGGENYTPTGSTLTAIGTIINDDSGGGSSSTPTVSFSLAAQTQAENAGAVTITVNLSTVSGSNVSIPFTTSGPLAISTDYTLSPASVVTIAAGATSGTITISLIDDALHEANKTLTVIMGTPTGATPGAITTHTLTVAENDPIGPFAVSGVSGGSDVTVDAILGAAPYPEVYWQTAPGANSYDVQIYENDGTTILACGTATSVVSTMYSFSACTSLVNGSTYKVKVTAKTTGGASLIASNSLFAFKKNTPPTAINDGPYLVMAGASNTVAVSPMADNLATGSADPDFDADGDSISITGATNGTKGTVTYTSSVITYSVTGSNAGADSFQYTITDSSGESVTATVMIFIMSPYTWTGDGANNNWATATNWCGSINANNTACVGGSAPSAGSVVYFDETCGGAAKCNVNITANSSIQGLKMTSGYTNTVTMVGSYSLTVGSGGLYIENGIFVGGTGNLTVNGPTVIKDAATMTATTGIWAVQDWNMEFNATFNHNNGTVVVGGKAADITFDHEGFQPFFNFEIADNTAAAFNLLGSMVYVEGALEINAPGSQLNGGSISAADNVMFTALNGGTTPIATEGPTSKNVQSSAGVLIPNLFIGGSGGGTTTLVGEFDIAGDFSYTGGATINAGTSVIRIKKVNANATLDFVGSIELNDLEIDTTSGGTVSITGSPLTLAGDLTVNHTGGGALKVAGLDVVVEGSYSVNCPGVCLPGFSTVVLAGPTGQQWNQTAGLSPFFFVKISKVSPTDTVELGGASTFYLNGRDAISSNAHGLDVYSGVLNLNGKTLMLNSSDAYNADNLLFVGADGTIEFNSGTGAIDVEALTNDGTINKNGAPGPALIYGTLGGSGSIN